MRITPVNQNNYKNNQNRQAFGMEVKSKNAITEVLLRKMVPDLDMRLGVVSHVKDGALDEIKVIASKFNSYTVAFESRGQIVYLSYDVDMNTVQTSKSTRVADLFLPTLDRLKLLVDEKLVSDKVTRYAPENLALKN